MCPPERGVFKLLIENGADPNAKGGPYGNALQAASENGHETVVRVLLDHGADVNGEVGWHGRALKAASSGGHIAIVELILAHGAIVDSKSGPDGLSALEVALNQRHKGVASQAARRLRVKS
ncbi:ankyrin repeat-containing domain protein [Mycena olivaceomarginata]|nr:ankyrin repeat-containing domain protein [Mycena olivaceomarginata]